METNMTSWHSYPSVYALGHRYLSELLLDDVLIEVFNTEKTFSFETLKDNIYLNSEVLQ